MNETVDKDEIEIDLLQLFKSMWHRLWAIILAAVLCGGVFLSYAVFLIDPTYEATALMYVNNTSSSAANPAYSISQSELSAAQTLVDTYLVILKSRTTLNDVIYRSGVYYTYEKLCKMVEAESVNGTEIFKIKVTSTSPEDSEKIANTITEVLPNKIANVVEGSSVRVVDHATTPTKKAGPSYMKYTTLGIILGILISCAVIVIQKLMDDQIQDEDYLTHTYGLPLLAVIPNLTESGQNSYHYGSGYEYTVAQKQRGKN